MSQKTVAADILKCGVSRIRVLDQKQAEEAITRQDIRNLIRKGVIVKIQKKGTSKAHSKYLLRQKKKGRRRGVGTRRGTFGARNPKKSLWIKTVRPLRKLLKELVGNAQVEEKNSKGVYRMIKGGAFRSKSHLLYYLRDHDMLKKKVVKQKKVNRPA
ncbi:MAG TPA: 50S ribosomal protein L19e [archaeon]|nr:50S ribosomal protein L19e [archaeon]